MSTGNSSKRNIQYANKTLPSHFCWTKMGDEAGQNLNGIIARKDAERHLGDGLFFWGIGSSLGQKFWAFVQEVGSPLILFSPMKSKAKKHDVKPEKIFAWTGYLDNSGKKHSIPKHALVTSRGTVGGRVKSYHYALVCHKSTPLAADEWPNIDSSKLRNYKSGSRLGFSQVTSLVESKNNPQASNAGYQVLFGANLVEPYFVTLVDPVEIPNALWSDVTSEWANKSFTASSWSEWIEMHMPKFKKVHVKFVMSRATTKAKFNRHDCAMELL